MLATASAARAQANVDEAADRLFHHVMSPYCVGRVLATCPSGQAEVLRQEVRRDLQAGKSPEAIEEALYQRFGDSIRSEPKTTGIGLLGWIIPAATFALTGLWLVARLRRVRDTEPEAVEAVPAVSRQMQSRLDDELMELN